MVARVSHITPEKVLPTEPLSTPTDSIKNELLYGVKEITAFMFGDTSKRNVRRTYTLVENKRVNLVTAG